MSPVSAKGSPFTAMTKEVEPFMHQLRKAASEIGAQVATIGILPTLTNEHLKREYMTDLPRYRALTNELSALKGEPFLVDINGKDSLQMQCDEVTLEGSVITLSIQDHCPSSARRCRRGVGSSS